jgi:hypothetical protein
MATLMLRWIVAAFQRDIVGLLLHGRKTYRNAESRERGEPHGNARGGIR